LSSELLQYSRSGIKSIPHTILIKILPIGNENNRALLLDQYKEGAGIGRYKATGWAGWACKNDENYLFDRLPAQ